jgi:hypothetical protein
VQSKARVLRCWWVFVGLQWLAALVASARGGDVMQDGLACSVSKADSCPLG